MFYTCNTCVGYTPVLHIISTHIIHVGYTPLTYDYCWECSLIGWFLLNILIKIRLVPKVDPKYLNDVTLQGEIPLP